MTKHTSDQAQWRFTHKYIVLVGLKHNGGEKHKES